MLDKVYSDEEREAYDAGYDCGVNGADTKNCNFSIFSTKARTKAWETGKQNAESAAQEGEE